MNKSKEKLAIQGGVEIVAVEENNKKVKRAVLNKEEILEKYEEVFYKEKEKIKFCSLEKCIIKTKKGEKVVKKGVVVAQALKKGLDEYLLELEERGIIRRSNSEWRNPIRAIQKPNGSIRLVSNFIALNDLCEKDPYELKNIRDVINATQGSNYFSVIDLKEGFYSIEIEEEDKKKTAFEFDGRVYEWNSMVMGFKNSPQILQRVMNKILEKEMSMGVSVYMDDVVIYGETRSEHDKIFDRVMNRFKENNLKVNKQKLQFALGEVELLGVKINGVEQSPNEIKKNETLTYPVPRNLKEMRRFLGLAGWFRKFIKDFAFKTAKMTDSLRKSSGDWKWNRELQEEFEMIKISIQKMGKIRLPDYNKSFVLKTDASNVGLGAVLLQEVEGELLPIQWASKKLTPVESRYTISEKEMLAIFWGIKKFDYDLRGRRFKIITDHTALENIRVKPNSNNNRINRWVEQIQEYDFSIEYQKPENLIGPDALSRLYENELPAYEKTKIKGEKIIQGKISKHVVKENGNEYWVSDNGLKRLMPEINKRKELIINIHEEMNHRGVEATYYKLKQNYYWIGMKKTVENLIKKCKMCAVYNRKRSNKCRFVETSRPFEKVALDLIDLRSDGKYILVSIDYYSRYVVADLIEDKKAETVLNIVERWTEEYAPELIITDNGKYLPTNYLLTRVKGKI